METNLILGSFQKPSQINCGVSEGELTNEVSPSDMFEIQYDGHTLQSKSARGLFVDFVKSMLVDDKYKQQIEELIAPNAPTAGVVFGRKV